MRRQRGSLAAAGLLALGLLLAGCGDQEDSPGIATAGNEPTADTSDAGNGDENGGASEDPEEAMLQFARCMREQGVDMPDPDVSDGTVRMRMHAGEDEDEVEKAMEACEEYRPKGPVGEHGKLDPEARDYMLKQARCMRDHGIDVPDPGPEGFVRFEHDMVDDPKFQEAMEACREQLGDSPLLQREGAHQ